MRSSKNARRARSRTAAEPEPAVETVPRFDVDVTDLVEEVRRADSEGFPLYPESVREAVRPGAPDASLELLVHEIERRLPSTDASRFSRVPRDLAEAAVRTAMEAVRSSIRDGARRMPRSMRELDSAVLAEARRVDVRVPAPDADPADVAPATYAWKEALRRVRGDGRTDLEAFMKQCERTAKGESRTEPYLGPVWKNRVLVGKKKRLPRRVDVETAVRAITRGA